MIRYSASKVQDQIVNYNNQLVEILSNIYKIVSSDDTYVNIELMDTSYQLPSFSYIISELTRMNNSINSIYGLDENGADIKLDGSNEYRRIITVNLNKEPSDITFIDRISTFKARNNWFYDKLTNPTTFVEVDLSDKIENDTQQCFIRRYVLDFARDSDGVFTTAAQRTLSEYNTLYRNNNNINIDDFIEWHYKQAGLVNPLYPEYTEEIISLEPNVLKYDGVFSVFRMDEDVVNRKLWYVIDTLNYYDLETQSNKQLVIGDELIINKPNTSTKYKILEINNDSEFKIRLEVISGQMPVPITTAALKLVSPILYSKRIRVGISYDERSVLFIKPLSNNNILSKNWSNGLGFYTNDLLLESSDSNDGLSMSQYYVNYVNDYGEVLKDLVAKKIPNKLAGVPNAPILNVDDFKVVQINKHLNDNIDNQRLSELYNQQTKLKSEIEQLNISIDSKNKQLVNTRFASDAARQQFQNELNKIIKTKESKSIQMQSIVSDIIELTKTNTSNVEPKYRVRGIFPMPEAIVTNSTFPQEVVQFIIQYKYLSKDGKENSVETYTIDGEMTTGVISNWEAYKTDARARVFNSITGEYEWVIQDVSDADTPKINQIDIPISRNEQVEIRVKSLSEVGWPEAPVESDWSNAIIIPFPDDEYSIVSDTDYILQEATKEEMKVTIYSDLNARGLDDVLNQRTIVDNRTYLFTTDNILSKFNDADGTALSLYELLFAMQNRINTLEEIIERAKGQLRVSIFNGSNERIVKNGDTIEYNVECEDYGIVYNENGIVGSRIYSNVIYVINDYILRVYNNSVSSPMGLLSNRLYNTSINTDIYRSGVSQVFWVNEQHDLHFDNRSGETKTQVDNQFIWSCNFDSIGDNSNVALSNNIGNDFTVVNDNSLISVLGTTEYNIGYNENSNLSFVSNNNSLTDISKWINKTNSVAAQNMLLTTVHPVIPSMNNIVETNISKVKEIDPGVENGIDIPMHIYFKFNALDPSKDGINYKYVNYQNSTSSVRHTKKVKFYIEQENDNRPFVFTVIFKINRNKVVTKKAPVMTSMAAGAITTPNLRIN